MGRFEVMTVVTLILGGCGRLGFEGVGLANDAAGDSALAYPVDDVNAVIGVTDLSLTPTYRGAPAFSISPALPAGVSLDVSTGVIAGIPTAVVDDVTYTVTATSAGSSASTTLSLTVLPGFVVDVPSDGADDDDGVDGTCHSTAAAGCSLRAALQTVNRRTIKQLILLGARTHEVTSVIPAQSTDMVIAGEGPLVTRVVPAVAHPGYGLFSLAASHSITLKHAAFDSFGTRNGAVVNATAGAVVVDACSFTDNRSSGSGGVFFFASGAVARIRRSTFTGNQSFGGNGWGGVIDGEDANTRIIVEQSTAIGNAAPWGSFAHITTGTTLRLENSTLFGNSSTIAGTLATPGGIYTLVNDTIVHNTNTNAVPNSAGIYLHSAPCDYTVANTIVAFNTDVNDAPHDCNRRDLTTSLASGGGNVFGGDGSNCGAYFTAPGDRLSTDPQLAVGAPADHGGSTATIVPLPTSLVLGIGQQCPAVDQRGKPRAATGCDAGAVELN